MISFRSLFEFDGRAGSIQHFAIPVFYSNPNSDNHFKLAENCRWWHGISPWHCHPARVLSCDMGTGSDWTRTRSKGVNANRNSVVSDGQPMEGNSVRSRLWLLILRELPFPLRWLVAEIVRFVQWIDSATAYFINGLRESPAWYFVTSIGVLAVFLTVMMFISLVNETSGTRSPSPRKQTITNLTVDDLERSYDWSVQDRWRIAHLFVSSNPAPKPRDVLIDSRLMASISRKARVTHPAAHSRSPQSSRYQNRIADELDVRLELSRPKMAQQGNRLVRGTVLEPKLNVYPSAGNRLQARDPRLLVQASWNFGSDCHPGEPVEQIARPIRRPTPVPLPQPEIERPHVAPLHNRVPQLAFEMAMVRHFSVAGHFPPGSHVANQSISLVLPESGHRFPSELVSHEESPWKPFQTRNVRSSLAIVPYLGEGVYEPWQSGNQILNEFDPALQAVADVALRIQLNTPELVSAGTLHESKLVIMNHGPDSVPRIEVNDFLSHLQTVVAASPPAMGDRGIDPKSGEPTNILHREIAHLNPGDSREMSLKWIPEGRSHQFYRAFVVSHAEVSTVTEVIQPEVAQQMPSIPPEQLKHHSALACDIQHLDRVTVGDELELEITVRNTGDTKLHQVKVQIVLPEQFSHRDGKTLVFDAGNLPVSGQNRTVVKLSATEAGDAIHFIHVNSEEAIEAHGRMTVQVTERRNQRELSITPPETTRATNHAPKNSVTVPRTVPLPSRSIPLGECCCQKAVIPQWMSTELVP